MAAEAAAAALMELQRQLATAHVDIDALQADRAALKADAREMLADLQRRLAAAEVSTAEACGEKDELQGLLKARVLAVTMLTCQCVPSLQPAGLLQKLAQLTLGLADPWRAVVVAKPPAGVCAHFAPSPTHCVRRRWRRPCVRPPTSGERRGSFRTVSSQSSTRAGAAPASVRTAARDQPDLNAAACSVCGTWYPMTLTLALSLARAGTLCRREELQASTRRAQDEAVRSAAAAELLADAAAGAQDTERVATDAAARALAAGDWCSGAVVQSWLMQALRVTGRSSGCDAAADGRSLSRKSGQQRSMCHAVSSGRASALSQGCRCGGACRRGGGGERGRQRACGEGRSGACGGGAGGPRPGGAVSGPARPGAARRHPVLAGFDLGDAAIVHAYHGHFAWSGT